MKIFTYVAFFLCTFSFGQTSLPTTSPADIELFYKHASAAMVSLHQFRFEVPLTTKDTQKEYRHLLDLVRDYMRDVRPIEHYSRSKDFVESVEDVIKCYDIAFGAMVDCDNQSKLVETLGKASLNADEEVKKLIELSNAYSSKFYAADRPYATAESLLDLIFIDAHKHD